MFSPSFRDTNRGDYLVYVTWLYVDSNGMVVDSTSEGITPAEFTKLMDAQEIWKCVGWDGIYFRQIVKTYQITWINPKTGDWVYNDFRFEDFHEAAAYGVYHADANMLNFRLLHIEEIKE